MSELKDLTGQSFSRWEVKSESRSIRSPGGQLRRYWLCECECGEKRVVLQYSLTSGKSKSCGCLQVELQKEMMTTHGKSYHPSYKAWQSMHQRCSNPNNPDYSNYGGRGISVCESWKCFNNFLSDMGCRPELKTLDRMDNNKGYMKSNCRWATAKEQAANRRFKEKSDA